MSLVYLSAIGDLGALELEDFEFNVQPNKSFLIIHNFGQKRKSIIHWDLKIKVVLFLPDHGRIINGG